MSVVLPARPVSHFAPFFCFALLHSRYAPPPLPAAPLPMQCVCLRILPAGSAVVSGLGAFHLKVMGKHCTVKPEVHAGENSVTFLAIEL